MDYGIGSPNWPLSGLGLWHMHNMVLQAWSSLTLWLCLDLLKLFIPNPHSND